jgi:hypothetical protein
MHILISGVNAAFGIVQMQWRHHQFEVVGDVGILR